mgnify:CR=1 FL=1
MDYTVLVVEDDEEIRKGIAIYLKNQGYQVLLAANGKEGLELLDKNTVHLAIVDVMMPVMDGISMVMQLRQTYEFPVIFLSARSEDMDKITGLNIGADDYVTKPFVPLELLARVNSHLRRYQKFLQLSSQNQPSRNLYVVGGLELDEETATVSVDGEVVKLTPMEYKILLLLMQNPGRVFPAEEIYQRVWNERAVNTDTVMVHLRNLRSKIEFDPKNPKYVKVVWGIGYKIEKI